MAKIFFSSNNHETCQSCRDCHADHLSSRYKRKFLTGRSSFSAKRVEKFLSSYLYAIYPKNETLSLVDPVPTKSKDIGGKGMGDVHKKFRKKFLGPWCVSGALLCWVSTFLHRWVCT